MVKKAIGNAHRVRLESVLTGATLAHSRNTEPRNVRLQMAGVGIDPPSEPG